MKDVISVASQLSDFVVFCEFHHTNLTCVLFHSIINVLPFDLGPFFEIAIDSCCLLSSSVCSFYPVSDIHKEEVKAMMQTNARKETM